MHTIYKITNTLTNQVYIGQATNVKARFEDYRKRLARGQPKLNESFLTYGTINHKFEILCTCLDAIADKLEIYFIEHYESYFYKYRTKGLNLTRSGRRGAGHPEETKAKIAKSLTDKKQSQNTLNKKKIKNSKPVLEIDKDLKIINTYPSLAELSRVRNISESTIRAQCKENKKLAFKSDKPSYFVRQKDFAQ
jgi:inhibitor of KinA sporulation pathway (predicted exonuclease)